MSALARAARAYLDARDAVDPAGERQARIELETLLDVEDAIAPLDSRADILELLRVLLTESPHGERYQRALDEARKRVGA